RSVFEDAYQRLKEAGLTVIVHLIFGLPGEDEETMLDSVRYLSNLMPRLDGVKLQLLQILRGTKIAEEFAEKPWHVMTLGEYAELLVKTLRLLPEETIVHRITGDGPKKLLIEPRWCADKKHVMNTLHKAIDRAEK
ncbi:MAG: TIGR01212 family radical SAM protein, partial [Lachnospiraceae bacterium]|nr:TIGR01212 family radical SAM protein [Lachnospiraceae bacterium]